MEKIKIGQIVNAVGLKGEVKVYNYSDSQERYYDLQTVYLDDKLYEIEKVRFQQHLVILKFKGVEDRNAAESLKGKYLNITEADLKELPEGTYYIRDLIGVLVVLESGEVLGTLTNVLQNFAQDLYEIDVNGKKVLLPAVNEFVLDVDLESRRVTVRLPEGLLDL
mgnify:FL=1